MDLEADLDSGTVLWAWILPGWVPQFLILCLSNKLDRSIASVFPTSFPSYSWQARALHLEEIPELCPVQSP